VTHNLETLGVVLLCSALIALAFFVILHNRRAAVNRRFGLSALAIAGWIISISFALSATSIAQTVFLGRFGFAFASAIPFTLLWMFDSFAVRQDDGRPRIHIILPGVSCGAFILLSFSPWIVVGATPGPFKANFVYGPAHRLFGLYFLLCFAFALYTLWKTTRAASGLRKLQLRYLLLGILLGGAGAITTNLLVPLFFKTSRYSALGPYFSLLVVSFSAHAIIRYRLMDIRVVIRKGVVYVCAIVASASIFALFVQSLKRLTGYERDSIPVVQALVAAVLLAIFFQPFKGWIQRSLNRYLYRETYDYQRTIREASRQLSTILSLDSLLDYLTTVIEDTFKVEGVAVYLRDPAGRTFIHKAPVVPDEWRQRTSSLSITPTSPLISFLELQQRTLVREEAIGDRTDKSLAAAGRALQELDGDIALPLMQDRAIVGAIIVGPKRSADPYFADDIDLLETLISQASVAMKNAHLYQQVVLANEYVDNILSTMDSGVVAVNASGGISLFNAAAERVTGLRGRDVLGQSLECLPAALAYPLRDTLEAHTSPSQFETSIPGMDARGLPLVCFTATLRHKNGSTHGALMVFSDLTRLKDLEREKRRAERLASFGALASGVAHEIKNPLVAIRTFAELLPERFADVDFREDFSKVVVREIERIDDLVGRLRGIAATAPQQVGKINLCEPIRDTLALLRAQLEQTRTTVHCTFEEPLPLVAVDEAQLKQLFLNLFLNALEAMGPGGELTVHTSRKELHGASWIVAEISDTGPGIPESVKTHIFDPFFTTKPRGSGLGLAICRGITDAHRGTIRAESGPHHKGTVISVEFPATNTTDRTVEHDTVRTVP